MSHLIHSLDIPGLPVWSSSDPGIATVDSTGLVTAIGEGMAAIAAAFGGAADTALISVLPETFNVDVTPPVDTLEVGTTTQLTALITNNQGDTIPGPPVWSSSATGIATVDSTGLVTATGEGMAAIAAAFGGAADTALITVVEPISNCFALPAGLVGWWPGEGNANDAMGNNYGVLEGGTTFATGMLGQAFSLAPPQDFVSVANDPVLNVTNAITVGAWINRTSTVGPVDPIVKKAGEGLAPINGWALEFDPRFAGPAFYVYIGSNWHPAQSPFGIPLGTWGHVVGTYDGSTIKIYVNGVLTAAAAASGTIVPSSNAVNFGADPANPDDDVRSFDGLIDEVQMFSRALTDGEITAIYDAGVSGQCMIPPS